MLQDLASEPNGLSAKGTAAQARVATHFIWSRKAEQVARVYDWVSAKEGAAPVLLD